MITDFYIGYLAATLRLDDFLLDLPGIEYLRYRAGVQFAWGVE